MDSKKTLIEQFNEFTKEKYRQTKNYLGPVFREGTNTMIKVAYACATKAKVAFNTLMPVLIEKTKSLTFATAAAIREINKIAAEKLNFNFRHLVMTTSAAAIVFALTITVTGAGRSKVSAAVLETTPEVEKTYNDEVMEVNYGDDSAIVDVAKEILADDEAAVYEAKPVTLANGGEGYEIGNYIVAVDREATKELGEEQIQLTVQTKETYNKDDFGKVVINDSTADVTKENGAVHTYKLNVKYVDTQAPTINLTQNEVEIDDTDTFNRHSFVQSITDNYDGVIEDYTIEGEVPEKDEFRWEAGDYTITYKATDANGNVGQASLKVKVNETEEEKEEEEVASNTDTGSSSDVVETNSAASYENAGSVLAAAYAQIGVSQDCTMLVTNSLKAVGINFHSAPAGYISLGTTVSVADAQPGDIIYYADGGAGVPHVAIYAGNGMAIHGGYMGTTKLASAWMGSGFVVIRL